MEERSKILLIEDDKVDQMAFERLVKREGLPYDYVVAGSVAEAKKILDRDQFDAVLIDYLLGDGTAFDLFNQIADTPIVIVTGSGDEAIAVEAMKAGALDYLTKDPAGNYLKTLPATVENAIRRKRIEAELKQHQENLEELVTERTTELTRANEQLSAEITERKQTEARLKLLSSAVEQSTEGVAVSDLAGNLLFVNRAFAALHGFDPEELVGQHLSIFHTPEQLPSVEAANLQTQETGEFSGEIWHVQRDGTVFPALMHNSLLRDEAGQAIGMIGTLRDITKQKQAEEMLQHRMEQLVALNQASQAVTASLELEQVLTEVVSLASQVVTSDYSSVVLVDEAGQMGKSAENVQDVPAIEYRVRENGLTAWIVRSGQPIIMDEISEDGTIRPELPEGAPRLANPHLVEAGIKSLVGLPLSVKDNLLGVLFLHSFHPGNFQDQLPLLTTFANQAAIAIENARLYEKERKQTAQLAVVNQVARKAVSILDPDQLLQEIVSDIRQGFEYHNVVVLLLDETTNELGRQAIAGGFADMAPPNYRQAVGEGIIGEVAKTGQPLLINDVSQDPRYIAGFLEEVPTKSEMCVPLKVADQVIGVLDVQETRLNAFEETDLLAMETLADQIAIAINNAQLYEEVQHELAERSRAEEEVLRRNRELALLNRVIAASAVSLEPEAILEIVCRELAQVFDVPQAAATLLNEQKTIAVVVAEYLTEGRTAAWGQRIPVENNPSFQYLLTLKAPLSVDDAQNDPRLGPTHELMRQRGTISLLLLPLVIGGEVIGSLELDTIEPRHFSTEEVGLAWSVADQVSGALARAQLDQEHRQLEDQFRQSQKMEAIGRLAGGMAHDFNNLLTVITGYSELLLHRHFDSNDPRYKDIEQIYKAAEQAAALTRQLLAFSRQQMIRPKVLDLNVIITDIKEMLRRLISEDIDLIIEPDPDLGYVKVDPGQIEQIIMNLVVNACDAMPQGGQLTIKTTNIDLDKDYAGRYIGLKPGSHVILTINDTGAGMDAETQSHIFEPFFTTKDKGTGLGLATVYGIVQQNKGHISVSSNPGKGTTFTIYLPRIDQATELADQDQVPTESLGGTETILLVEDEDMVRELARYTLLQNGYKIVEARHGQEALELCEQYEDAIHLLLTDIVMPGGLSGYELAKRLTSLQPEIKVIYMSGYVDKDIIHHVVLDPEMTFLQKPFSPSDLARRVREILDVA
jgi:PAS domain S-box-containing protein